LVTTVNSGKTADSIETPLEMVDHLGSTNDVVDGGPDPPTERGTFWVNWGGAM